MTDTQASDAVADDLIDEADVAAFLRDDAEFFERHPDLLTSLRLPHASGGTVSLVERQMDALRGEAAQLKQQIRDLVLLARDNEELNQRLHQLTLALIDAVDFGDVITLLEDHLHDQFRADAVELKLFSTTDLDEHGEATDPELAAFLDFFERNNPVCGPLSEKQLDYLFGTKPRTSAPPRCCR